MWENNSSRACSNAVGVDGRRGAGRCVGVGRAPLPERGPGVQKPLGNARGGLFTYEGRPTYDTPEIAESRRIGGEGEGLAREAGGEGGEGGRGGHFEDDEDDEPWRRVGD